MGSVLTLVKSRRQGQNTIWPIYYPMAINLLSGKSRTLGTGQRFTPKKRTVPVICFESGIDHIAYQLYGLTEDEIKIIEES